jgi:hypothetical protein
MIYKYLIIAFVLIISLSKASANTTDSLPGKRIGEIGIQANQLVKQALSFSGNTVPFANPYLLNGKFYLSPTSKLAMRMGFGMTIDIGNTNTATSNSISRLNSFDFRIGMDKRSKLYKNLYLISGWDFLLGVGSHIIRSNFNGNNNSSRTSTTSFKMGGGPMMGIEYYINPAFKFGIEGTYYATIYSNTTTNNSLGRTTDVGFNFTMSPPAVLFFSYILYSKPKK